MYRVLSDGKVIQEFDYNSDGMVTRQTFYGFADKKSSETIYLYNPNKKLVKTESFFDVSASMMTQQLTYGYSEYKYGNDGRLSEERTYSKNGSQSELRSVIVPTYDANGRAVNRFQSLDNKPFNLYKYEYDNKGNVIVQESYRYEGATPILGFRSIYEHDNKKNPYVGLIVIPFSVNRNNIIKHTTTNYNLTPGTPVVTTTQTVYKKYNANDLPVEVVEYGTSTFIYQYK